VALFCLSPIIWGWHYFVFTYYFLHIVWDLNLIYYFTEIMQFGFLLVCERVGSELYCPRLGLVLP
jgi:hypothetical protein